MTLEGSLGNSRASKKVARRSKWKTLGDCEIRVQHQETVFAGWDIEHRYGGIATPAIEAPPISSTRTRFLSPGRPGGVVHCNLSTMRPRACTDLNLNRIIPSQSFTHIFELVQLGRVTCTTPCSVLSAPPPPALGSGLRAAVSNLSASWE